MKRYAIETPSATDTAAPTEMNDCVNRFEFQYEAHL